jgi:REP element-mobilizing transposase RayT
MPYNPTIHHRKSIRLKGYDYSKAGLYFITICTNNHECLFGFIKNGEMILNDAGNIANNCWLEIPNHFPNVRFHEYIIMPNHIHGIIEIVGANNHSPVPNVNNPPVTNVNNHSPVPNVNNHCDDVGAKDFSPLRRSPSKTIGSVVRGFKIGVTKWFRQNNDVKILWQRNYYEHIIRNQQSYDTISNYILYNPAKWHNDKFFK